MNTQYRNYTTNAGIYKSIRRFEFERKGTVLNLPIPFVVEPSLVDQSQGNMYKVNLRDNPKDKDSEVQMQKFPIRDMLTVEDLLLLIDDINLVIKYRPVELADMKFTTASMMMKGEAKTNWEMYKKKVTSQIMVSKTRKDEDGNPIKYERGINDTTFDLTIKEFMKRYVKPDAMRVQKSYMRYNLFANYKFSVSQTLSHLMQMNEYIPKLTICSDNVKLPDFNIKDILLLMHKPKLQIKVKVGHTYEELTPLGIGDLLDQYRTEEAITTVNAKNTNEPKDIRWLYQKEEEWKFRILKFSQTQTN